jgi:superfamily II DNA or RNA helicase
MDDLTVQEMNFSSAIIAGAQVQNAGGKIQALERDEIAAVVAINCLDEGVDVPQVKEAIILASSANKRQFVQRRGRILRKASGKQFAHLIDICTVPPRRYHEEPPSLLYNELQRMRLLATAADNRYQVELVLVQELERFGLPVEDVLGVTNDID